MTPPSTLLVAAVVEELCGLPGEPLGVGMVAAAARTARLLATRAVEHVVLVGTAGAYAGGPEIGAVVTAGRVGLGSGTAALRKGYVPLAPPPIRTQPAPSLPEVTVLCCTAITTDPALAHEHSWNWQVEHMEAFGVATACADAGVPLTVILGITNVVGPDAHVEWRANRDAMQRAVAAAAAAFVAHRPPGG